MQGVKKLSALLGQLRFTSGSTQNERAQPNASTSGAGGPSETTPASGAAAAQDAIGGASAAAGAGTSSGSKLGSDGMRASGMAAVVLAAARAAAVAPLQQHTRNLLQVLCLQDAAALAAAAGCVFDDRGAVSDGAWDGTGGAGNAESGSTGGGFKRLLLMAGRPSVAESKSSRAARRAMLSGM